ncbi:MAG: aldehyde dehydrogenase family protein [Nitrospirae bacterium]|nr:MAG: aldehyde dehydrogenase family protein [Nitrospirota bacterium]
MKEIKSLLVGGRWVETKKLIKVTDPFGGKTIASVYAAGAEETEAALSSADNSAGDFASMPAHARAKILTATAESISSQKDEFAKTITLETGKPIKESRVEADRAALTFRIAAEEAVRIGGEFMPLDRSALTEKRWGITRRFPCGTVLGITPFNFPLNLVAHKVAPAIAAGNPIIIKPATKTPLTALLLGRAIIEAGLPEGCLSVLPCDSKLAEKLVVDGRIKVVSFTGSAHVGWHLKSKVPYKKVLLELGGNAGVYVDEDADIEYAVKRCVAGSFSFAGQVCISVQRIFLHQKIYHDFLKLFISFTKKLKAGDPMNEDTDIGPVIDLENKKRIDVWLAEAKDKGAKIVAGGESNGTLYPPTVLVNVRPSMKICCMEAFAPVVTVSMVDSFEDGLEAINDSIYGLQAGVFTKDIKKAFNAFERIEAGGVLINDVPSFRADHMPYGGVKQSGFGREGVRYAIEEMTELKLMVLNLT